jgi:fucose permease
LFLFSKIVTGAGIGVLMTTCQTYVSEISPVKLRGALLAIFPFAVSIGQLIAVTLVFSRITIMDISSFRVSRTFAESRERMTNPEDSICCSMGVQWPRHHLRPRRSRIAIHADGT